MYTNLTEKGKIENNESICLSSVFIYNITFLIRECDKKTALQSLSDMLFNNK